MTNSRPTPAPTGIFITTSITAGACPCPTGECSDPNNHAEGVVVSTALVAGAEGREVNHAEGLV